MSNISVTTVQNTIEVTETSGITVTTPEGQTINVEVPNSSVNVTNTTDDITILTAGTLNIQTGGITSVNGNTGPVVVLDTDDISEGATNKYYTDARFDTRFATKTTTNLAEGTNLYYTTARANTDFDTRLATKTTTNLAEGTNLYYTDARFDTRLATKDTDDLNEGTTNLYFTNTRSREAISATDTGGDGSLSYDNSTGVITYTGPSASEVRAHFSAGTGVTITNGQIAIGQPVATTDDVTFDDITANGKFIGESLRLTTDSTRTFPESVPLIIKQDGASTFNNIQSWKSKGTYASPTTITPGDVALGLSNIVYTGTWDGVTPSVGTESGWSFGGDLYWQNATNTATDTVSPIAQFGYSTTRGSWNLSTFQTPDSDSPTSTIQDATTWKFDGQRLKVITNDIGGFFNPVDSTPKITAVKANGDLVDFKFKSNGNFELPGDIKVGGNDIQASDGATNITLTSNSLTAFAGDIKVNGGDINGPTGSYLNIQADDHINIASPNFVHFNKTPSSTAGVSIHPGGDADNTGSLIYESTYTSDGTQYSRVTLNTFKTSDGINFTPTQANTNLGSFTFNGNDTTSTSPSSQVPGAQIFAYATENWTSSANGSGMNFFVTKQGTTTSYPVVKANPSGSEFWADTFNFYTASATPVNTLSIDSSGNVIITGDLQVNGGDITNSTGALTISTGASDGAITLDPNGSGDIVLTLANGGNLTNSRNYVYGGIRNSTTESNGDAWSLLAGAGTAYRGISLDNSIDTTKRPGMTIRSYGISGGAPRTGIIMEGARGTAASPSNLNSGDVIGDIFANGYTSTGWASDQVNIVPGIARFYTTEAWNDGLNKVGTGFRVLLQPPSTTLTTSSVITALEVTTNSALLQKLLTVANNRSTGSSDFATINFSTQKFTSPNYIPTSAGDVLGEFKYNGNTSSGPTSSPGAPAAQIGAKATENWTSTANGTEFYFNATKTGTLTQVPVITGSSSSTIFNSDSYTFADSTNTAVTSAAINYTRTYGEFAYVNASGFGFAAQNTIYTMPIDTTNFSSGITASGTGSININVSGTYKIIMSLQASMTTNSVASFRFWLRKNGTDVANSATEVDLLKDQKSVIAMDWMVQSDGNDYFEIVYATSSIHYADLTFPTIAATSTPYVCPLAPAVIFNVLPIGA